MKTNPGPDPRPGPECAPGPVAVHGCSDALALFVDRAAAAAPGLDLGLELDDVARAAAEALCRRLDGIPLAIELAAAQLSDCSLDALSERLHSRFEVLTARHHAVSGALARHSTLRTTIGWSHELCTPLERLLWARLSVFAGGFDLNAAESVCSGGPLPARTVPETLDGLVAKSLVRPRADGPGPVLRYGMLDTVREYGTHWLRELGEDEADAARRRHRDFYRELARRADAEWFGPHQVSWYERTVADHANLRCALDFCLTDADGRSALEMGGALWFFWCGCGFAREGRHYLEQALDRFPAPGPHRARAVWACGLSALAQGDADAAARLGRNFRTAAESRSDPAALTVAAYLDGASLMQLGKNRDAAVVLDAAPYTQDHGSTYTAVRFLSGVVRAFVHANLGEFDDAAVVAAGLRTESVRRGERWGRAWADWILALSAFGLGRPDEAASFARTALEGKALFHDSLGSAVAVDLLASAAVATGRSERAARLLGIGQRIWETLGLSQLGMPELVAAREATERQARQDIGDTAYETAYGAGLESDIDEGIAYGLRPCT
ncbi:regulator [Streptomyces sp. NPDC050704]|uniref:ATP-binding protein n=1 Tax=Streptomyces sp. NPDC050704 TaxID=3157219 RepID=UPI003412FCC8